MACDVTPLPHRFCIRLNTTVPIVTLKGTLRSGIVLIVNIGELLRITHLTKKWNMFLRPLEAMSTTVKMATVKVATVL